MLLFHSNLKGKSSFIDGFSIRKFGCSLLFWTPCIFINLLGLYVVWNNFTDYICNKIKSMTMFMWTSHTSTYSATSRIRRFCVTDKTGVQLTPQSKPARQNYRIGTARKMSEKRHPRSVVAYSAEVAHRAVPIQQSFVLLIWLQFSWKSVQHLTSETSVRKPFTIPFSQNIRSFGFAFSIRLFWPDRRL